MAGDSNFEDHALVTEEDEQTRAKVLPSWLTTLIDYRFLIDVNSGIVLLIYHIDCPQSVQDQLLSGAQPSESVDSVQES
jgi:hypothetical protein